MAKVKIATVRQPSIATTGTQDFTVSGFGEVKAALFICARFAFDTFNEGGAQIGIGATDGVRQWVFNTMSNDGIANTFTTRRGMTDKCVAFITTTGAIEGEASFDSFITDGIRINWTNGTNSVWLITAILFGGDELEVRADTVNLGTVTTAQTYNTMGFEADVLICGGHNAPMDDTTTNFFTQWLGLVHNDRAGTITQRMMAQVEEHNQAAGEPYSRMMEDKFGAQLTIGSGAVDHEYTMSNFSSSGFQFTSSANTSSDRFNFLALRFGSLRSQIGTYSPPTTPSLSTINPGWKPQFCLIGMNGCESVDVAQTDARAGKYGIAVMDANLQFSNAITLQDTSATINTSTVGDDIAIYLQGHSQTSDYSATLSSMDDNGLTLDYSLAGFISALWIYLLVEAETQTITTNISLFKRNKSIYRR